MDRIRLFSGFTAPVRDFADTAMSRSDAAIDAHCPSPRAHDRAIVRNSKRNAVAAHTKKSRVREWHLRKTFNKNRREFLRSVSHRERTAMRDTLTA